MEENIVEWRERRQGISNEGAESNASSDNLPSTRSGTGAWDEALGVPICVVCQNAHKIDVLERELGWKQGQSDFIFQYLRTVLLKHGASLIYLGRSNAASLQTLIHTSLGIESPLRKRTLKHELIDRERIVIPPTWDSWGKIRVFREGFDVEGVSKAWTVDVQVPFVQSEASSCEDAETAYSLSRDTASSEKLGAAVTLYEETIRSPETVSSSGLTSRKRKDPGIEVQSTDNQTFLANQLQVIERFRFEDEEKKKVAGPGIGTGNARSELDGGVSDQRGRMHEHAGPVKMNIGGIDVDADAALRHLKVGYSPGRNNHASSKSDHGADKTTAES